MPKARLPESEGAETPLLAVESQLLAIPSTRTACMMCTRPPLLPCREPACEKTRPRLPSGSSVLPNL